MTPEPRAVGPHAAGVGLNERQPERASAPEAGASGVFQRARCVLRSHVLRLRFLKPRVPGCASGVGTLELGLVLFSLSGSPPFGVISFSGDPSWETPLEYAASGHAASGHAASKHAAPKEARRSEARYLKTRRYPLSRHWAFIKAYVRCLSTTSDPVLGFSSSARARASE